jgi:hypothetical protein
VDATIDYLRLRFNNQQENALALLLRVLCERVDPGDQLHDQLGRLANELDEEIRRSGPTYSPARIGELQTAILTAAQPAVRDAFLEFTQQVEAYLDEFGALHRQLEEWKEVHNILQDLQSNFAPCRSYIFSIGRLKGEAEAVSRQREKMLYEVEVEWRPCHRALGKLQELATSVQAIGQPYQHGSNDGPTWFLPLRHIADDVGRALVESDCAVLADQLSAFGDRIDQSLYLADKSLREVINKMNRLPQPGIYPARRT